MIREQEISKLIEDNMMSYSAAVLLNRAIPDLRDGLKPSTKRIIYSMYSNGMDKFTKSLDVVGTVSKIHPHSSTYPAIVGMCQTDKHMIPYLDYNGNMGQHTSRDIQAAADRYTDVRLSQFTMDLLENNLKKDIVEWEYNYDGKIKVPTVLPFRFPTILTHSQSGIGVGFASNIASYNVVEIADNVIKYLRKGKMDNLIPDFATGGEIIKNEEIFDRINSEGSGTVKIRATAAINGNEISFTEIPYTTTREAIIDKIVELATDELSEVIDVKDLTGNNKMEVLVVARKGTDMEMLLEKLYMLTPLESGHSSNNMVLVDGLPVQLGTKEILTKWIEWRRQCVDLEIKHDIATLQEKLFELDIMEKLNEKTINKIISIIRKNKKTKSIELITKLGFTYREAEFVYELRLNQLNIEYIDGKVKEKKVILDEIDAAENKNIDDIIIEDMKFFKKEYNQPRRSKLITPKVHDIKQVIKQDLIDDSDYYISITKNGYVIKHPNKNSKLNGIAMTDHIKYQWKVNNAKDQIFVFTHSRKGYKSPVRDLELDKTYYIPSLLKVNIDDICDYGCVSEYYPNIVLVLEKGRIVKFNYESYEPGVKVFANTHNEQYYLVKPLFLDKDHELTLIDNKGNKNIVNTKDIRVTKNRTGSGQFIHSSRRNEIVDVLY